MHDDRCPRCRLLAPRGRVSAQARDSHRLLLVPDHTLVGHELPDAPEYRRRKPEDTVLYRVVQENLETFLSSTRDQGRVVPRFVERELRAFLDCGLLCRGFLRVRCEGCGRERLVAYSCYLELKTIRSRERESLDSWALATAVLQIVSDRRARR